MLRAGGIMQKHGTVIDTESGDGLHVSLEYFCCQTAADAGRIAKLYKGFAFPALNVTFDRAVCRVDYDDGPGLGFVQRAAVFECGAGVGRGRRNEERVQERGRKSVQERERERERKKERRSARETMRETERKK